MSEVAAALRIIYCEVASRLLVVFLGLIIIVTGLISPKYALELLRNGGKKVTLNGKKDQET
jgi:hypothetical protein